MSASHKSLNDLGLTALGGVNPEISGISLDSRRVRRGDVFGALPGTVFHGAEFAQQVIDAGAAAIVTDKEGLNILRRDGLDSQIAVCVTEDPHSAFSGACALWFGAQPKSMVAVTGTNGKTSVASFCRQIWTLMGKKAVNIGTTGVEGAWTTALRHTTPDPITLYRVLAEASDAGVTHAAMEASSHGLDQKRLEAVSIKAAGFTNFTQDHLDYHETFEAYFEAKMGLFDRLLPDDGWAVVNMDDPKGPEVAKRARLRGRNVMTVGKAEGCDLRLIAQRFVASGQVLRFEWLGEAYQRNLSLIGGFQAENVLLACGLVIAAGAAPEDVFATLQELETVRGRMECAAERANGAIVYVDYAHTPDAIETALSAFRPHVMGRLIAVIGAGGDRDTTKRPLMAAAAERCADFVIVTDDNPRSEDPETIRKMVLAGAKDKRLFLEIADRAEAILRAVDMLQEGDALLITGKGHETGQIVGDDVLPFDDVEQASLCVAALDGHL